jgi:hypothetical protein
MPLIPEPKLIGNWVSTDGSNGIEKSLPGSSWIVELWSFCQDSAQLGIQRGPTSLLVSQCLKIIHHRAIICVFAEMRTGNKYEQVQASQS